jgi:hypothetical protein
MWGSKLFAQRQGVTFLAHEQGFAAFPNAVDGPRQRQDISATVRGISARVGEIMAVTGIGFATKRLG